MTPIRSPRAPFNHPLGGRLAFRRGAAVAMAAAGGLGALALCNWALARRAERRNPPTGAQIEVDGVRLHYLDKGEGSPIVLLHGNGSSVEDFSTSGLIDALSAKHRVIAFDRPGYGHSSRPRGRSWTPEAQADLIHSALRRLGLRKATVVGHSWGAIVAAALAQRHPEAVSRLVLLSGYYFPSLRLDAILLSGPALPILGDVARWTVAPWLTRAAWPLLMRKIFGPQAVPTKFRAFPKEMVWRPSQLRASAEETALMIPAATRLEAGLDGLRMPVAIGTGDADRVVDWRRQSARLHGRIPGSRFRRFPGAGHMIHQTATRAVVELIRTGAPVDAEP